MPSHLSSLKSRTVNGVIWSVLERFVTLILQFSTTLIIAQFVTPADFGLIGMLNIFLAVSQTLLDSGFGQALIQKKKNRQHRLFFSILFKRCNRHNSIFYFV